MKKEKFIPLISILVIAVVLLGMSFGLNGLAAANAQKAHIELMKTILPGSENFTLETYGGEDTNIQSVHKGETGFVVETLVQGYADEIRMLVGVTNDGRVNGLVVCHLRETYGLGANALTDHVFLAQYLNTSGEAEVGTTVDAITGATVTSKAVTRSVNSAVAYVTGADTESAATSWGG